MSDLRLAHFVVQTNQLSAMRDWYCSVLKGHVVFDNGMMCFITFDDEHHRLAFMQMTGGLAERPPNSVGLMHSAFTFPNLNALLERYRELKGDGITPQVPIQHGPTTSLYYRDPDGCFAELQVDNFSSPDEATAFMHTEEYTQDPLGPVFDPERLIDALESGAAPADVTTREWARTGPPMPDALELFAQS